MENCFLTEQQHMYCMYITVCIAKGDLGWYKCAQPMNCKAVKKSKVLIRTWRSLCDLCDPLCFCFWPLVKWFYSNLLLKRLTPLPLPHVSVLKLSHTHTLHGCQTKWAALLITQTTTEPHTRVIVTTNWRHLLLITIKYYFVLANH